MTDTGDIIDTITDALMHLPVPGRHLRFAAMQVAAAIQPAILAAEKRGAERAAKIAEQIGEAYGDDEAGWLDCSENIAAAIRKEG